MTCPTFAIVGEKGPEEIRPLNKPSMLRGGDTYVFNTTVNGSDEGTAQRFEATIVRVMQRQRRAIRGRLAPGL